MKTKIIQRFGYRYSSMSCVSSSEKSLIELSLEDSCCSCSRNASSVAYFFTYSENMKTNIRKTYLCKLYPFIPHFYTINLSRGIPIFLIFAPKHRSWVLVRTASVKLGYAGVYLFFLIFATKHRLWVLVRTSLVFSYFCSKTEIVGTH